MAQKKGGRNQITYDKSICEDIFKRLSQGETLRAICKSDEKYPDESTIRLWIRKDPELFKEYAAARDIGLDCIADKIISIAADGSNDFHIDPATGKQKLDKDHVNRSRLLVDTLKWYLCKQAPKRYGERITQEITGKDGQALGLSDGQLAAKLDALAMSAKKRKEDSGE